MFKFIGDTLRSVIDLFFTRRCAVCGRELLLNEKYLCLSCYAELPLTYFWNYKDNAAEEVFWGRVEIERVYSLYYFINRYRAPIHKLKYKSNLGVGLYLGEMLGEKIAEEINSFNYIVPIPLHWRKLQKRGYNQANIIAKGINRAVGGKIINNLIRRREFTKTQTQKDRIDRWKNVSAAFAINKKGLAKVAKECDRLEAKGKRSCKILLVDDVLTTGATLEVCALLIKSNLKAEVYIATLAYVE